MLEVINQKNMNFLFEIAKKPRNISELAKRADSTVSSASTLISRLERENVINKTESDWNRGKCIIITLTEYGEKQVRLLRQILKNHRENKRLTSPKFLDKYKRILNKKGIIYLKTDNSFFFNYTLEIIQEYKHKLIFQTPDLYKSGITEDVILFKTFYEKMFLEKKIKIKYLKFSLSD